MFYYYTFLGLQRESDTMMTQVIAKQVQRLSIKNYIHHIAQQIHLSS